MRAEEIYKSRLVRYTVPLAELKAASERRLDCAPVPSVWKSTSVSVLGDGAAVLPPSSGEEPASPRHRAGVASMSGGGRRERAVVISTQGPRPPLDFDARAGLRVSNERGRGATLDAAASSMCLGTVLPRRGRPVPEPAPQVRDIRAGGLVGLGRRLGRGPGAVGGIVVVTKLRGHCG